MCDHIIYSLALFHNIILKVNALTYFIVFNINACILKKAGIMPTSRGSKQKNGRSKKQHTCKHISTKLKEESELAFSVDIKEEPIDQDILPKIPAAVKDDLKDHLEKFCTSATIKK